MSQESNISKSPCYTLYDAVNEFMALNQINQKKYLASYLIAGKAAWKEIFKKTMYVTNSIWLTVQADKPYPYIVIPRDCERIFYVGETDCNGNVQPIYYNNSLNIIPKPTVKKCGCESCDCSGLCEDLNSSVFTTNVIFNLNNIDYVEKTWMKYCPNGDVIEYKETPTKQYNSFGGDGGDFNNDFNNDYSIGAGSLSDFIVVTTTTQRKICTLQTYPCGCPIENQENEEVVRQFCSCFMPFFGSRRREHSHSFLADTNRLERGEVKISECGTKIYYRPSLHHHHHEHEKKIPDFLQLSYQTNGDPKMLNQQIQVPDYAKLAMWAGTYYFIRAFNGKYTRDEKLSAKWAFNSEQNDLIGFLNPLSMQDLSDAQDLPVRW